MNGKNQKPNGELPKLNKKNKIYEFKFKLSFKNFFVAVLVAFFLFSIFLSYSQLGKETAQVPVSKVMSDVKDGKVDKIIVEDNKLTIEYKDGTKATASKEPQDTIYQLFYYSQVDPKSVTIENKDTSGSAVFWSFLANALPVLLLIGVFIFIFRQARGAQDNIFSFGQSKARLFNKDNPRVTFKDVAGVDEAKKELEEVVDFLKHPGKYRALGARTPKGVLLVGPSGTGKTLLARAVAGEAGVPFFSMAGSEFMEMLVGVGASRVRDLFNTAKKSSPAIIFIDEIDAIGRMRSVGVMGGHDEREQTLNQILVEMDGFEPSTAVLVVAASVSGETPILIKQDNKVKLIPIGKFVDEFYSTDNEEGEKKVNNIQALGFSKKEVSSNLNGRLYFDRSEFKKISSVFRHRVNNLYKIEYLGGEVRATGNHSVFVRSQKGLITKAVADLKSGDILVDLPYKANRGNKNKMKIRKHYFNSDWNLTLPLFDQEIQTFWEQKYLSVIESKEIISQSMLAKITGVSQGTVSHWQRGIGYPRAISRNYVKYQVPEEVKVTPELCRLFGYYVAEGYARWELDFCFSTTEAEYIEDVSYLIMKYFGLTPDRMRRCTPGAVNIVYSSVSLAHFFSRYCGKGAKNKHMPSFLFEAPYEYFLEFLRGVFYGDGYQDKRGRGEITSMSKQLILELNWLCRMHGIKTYIHSFTTKEGRVIHNGKPLESSIAWRLGWGKANNPFEKFDLKKTYPVKRAIIKKVTKLPFNGFVYDLCGVDNEAFFGGESPILLHNTNRGDLLDPALLRPGRFDRRIALDLPDIEGRQSILKIHARGKPFSKAVDWNKVAKRTVGFSGADLENMLNESAILAARHDKKEVDMHDIEEAATKVKLGPEKRRLQTDLDKKMTAYHEAGHAVVTHELPHLDPVYRISIVSRGMALGFNLVVPSKDRLHVTQSQLTEQITSMLGGRAAEEIIFKEFTSGASNDIDKATSLARNMVIEFGMSNLGPINFGPQIDVTDWGNTYFEKPQISPDMQSKIDSEIGKIMDKSYKAAVEILTRLKPKLDKIAQELIKKETIEGDEFEKLMGYPKRTLAVAKAA